MNSVRIAFLYCCLASAGLAGDCEALKNLAVPTASVTLVENRSASEFTIPGGRAPAMLPAFCRVALTLKPSSDSEVRMEIWLPAAGWNGKFQGVGNGGYAGSISYPGLIDAVRNHYAAASTDTGHQDNGQSARWALNHPEKIVDFGYRAIHETAVTAKTAIRAYYGEAPRRSYFNSCSNGGRQALMEAQRFPADYDGIVAGAPANNWTHLVSSAASGAKAMLSEPGHYLPASLLPAVQAAALAQCDAADGVRDGLIGNPTACRFDPAVLLCHGSETATCLSAPQLGTLKTVYAGLQDSKGRPLMPGLSPGGEADAGGWNVWVSGPAPEKSSMFAYGTQFFKNMVYNDPEWQYRSFDADRDVKAADDKLAATLNAVDPDLSTFARLGGKLLLYHGWSDPAIPALSTIQYYESVSQKLGADKIASFSRLYMVPGMGHCGGGSGPNDFGQASTPAADRFHSLDAALEAWVEQGRAPESIIAARHQTNDPESAVVRTRPLCPWPSQAKYRGTGSIDDAANFSCVQ